MAFRKRKVKPIIFNAISQSEIFETDRTEDKLPVINININLIVKKIKVNFCWPISTGKEEVEHLLLIDSIDDVSQPGLNSNVLLKLKIVNNLIIE